MMIWIYFHLRISILNKHFGFSEYYAICKFNNFWYKSVCFYRLREGSNDFLIRILFARY